VSYIKALDVFFIISFFFVFGAVLEYVIVILHHEKKLKEQKKKKDRAEVEMVPLRQVNFGYEKLLKELRFYTQLLNHLESKIVGRIDFDLCVSFS